jgi:TolB protein
MTLGNGSVKANGIFTTLTASGAAMALGLALLGCRAAPVETPIAFLAQGDDVWQVWSMATPESKPIRITYLKQDVARLSWYPNGQDLLLNLQDGTLVKLDTRSGESTRLDFPTQGVLDATIGPDGRTIAYSVSLVDSSDRNDIWLHDSATGKQRKLTTMPALQHDPVWSLDGKTVYFLSGAGQQAHDLWRVDVASGKTRQLTVGALYHFDPSVRKDGAIVYSGNAGGDYDLWLLKDGDAPQALTDDSALDARPSWSSDGRALVFESARDSGVPQIWRYELSTKQLQRLTNVPGGARMPVWAPAGGAR